MKLEQVQTTFADRAIDQLFRCVYKNPHLHYCGWQISNHLRRLFNWHITRTLLMKYEPKRIRASFYSSKAVIDICDAANFNYDRHLSTEHSIELVQLQSDRAKCLPYDWVIEVGR